MVCQLALRLARELVLAEDPLEVELLASTTLGLLDRPLVGVDDPIDFLGRRFVRYVVRRRSSNALVLLVGLESVGPSGTAAAARTAADSLRKTRIARPPWAERSLASRFVASWTSGDEFGDQDLLVGEFERDGWPNYSVATTVDHNAGGMAMDLFVSPDPIAFRDAWVERSGMPVVDLPVQDYVDRVTHALDVAVMADHPAHEEDEADVRAFLRARLRHLPPARPMEPPEITEDQQERLGDAFAESPMGAPLGDRAGLAMHFIEFAIETRAIDPLRWSPLAVELCLLDWLPRKVTMDEADLAGIPDVLRAWVRFAGERRGLRAAAIEETVIAIGELEADHRAAMRDPTRFGPARSVISAMLAEGVPFPDRTALDAWLAEFSSRPQAERDRVMGHLRAPRKP